MTRKLFEAQVTGGPGLLPSWLRLMQPGPCVPDIRGCSFQQAAHQNQQPHKLSGSESEPGAQAPVPELADGRQGVASSEALLYRPWALPALSH